MHRLSYKVFILRFIAFLLLSIAIISTLNIRNSFAGVELLNRSVELNTPLTGQVSTYFFSYTYTNTSADLGSVKFLFCANTPLEEDPCVAPSGFDATNAVLSKQTGETGFNIYSASANQIIITRNPSVPTNTNSTYQFDQITNPNAPGSYYIRISTYSSTDASGPNLEFGGLAYPIIPAFTVSTYVPPYLTFCVAVTIGGINCGSTNGDQINFGNFSSRSVSFGQSQFVVATNAKNGYSVTIDGTTLDSGNNEIPAITTPTTSIPGVSQFGLNLVANTNPKAGQDPTGPGIGSPSPNYALTNEYIFNPGDIIASAQYASDYRKYTASYIVNVNSSQPVGVYATTMSFICLANF